MPPKSFCDLDYIIEINERRIEQYLSAYQKVLDRFTNIVLIYSAICIFLISIIQDTFFCERIDWLLLVCFCDFSILFIVSLYNAVRLIIPVDMPTLMPPEKHYRENKLLWEKALESPGDIEVLLNAAYVKELELAVINNLFIFQRKATFYYNALVYALISAIPYVICVAIHISGKSA